MQSEYDCISDYLAGKPSRSFFGHFAKFFWPNSQVCCSAAKAGAMRERKQILGWWIFPQ
jgi:hypothetical protein